MKLEQSTIFRYHLILVIVLITHICAFSQANDVKQIIGDPVVESNNVMQQTTVPSVEHVVKKTLDNGLTILVHESHTIPKVSFQIWYNVGSKDEGSGEKGIAHLIEHMIFKGTDILSESDINTLVHKLSGSCNAFTSFDYTGYLFNFPTHHWQEAFPVVADCMTNCSFNDDMLNSEMKAVIQELKMYRDQYDRSLMEEMIGMVFSDHPYHYPIIGYKQDLWSVSGKDLHAFYRKHYKPNNATLVVVGDVKAQDVFNLAEKYFGDIPKDSDYRKKKHFYHKDISSKSLTMYRDVAQPTLMYMFVVPGASDKQDVSLEILEWILGKGKSSRLYKKLVNETQLATDVSVGFWNLFDYGVFFVMIDPKDKDSFGEIEELVIEQLEDLAKNGIQDDELERGYKKTQMAFYSLLEGLEEQAYAIGQTYLATGDENYVFTALNQPMQSLNTQIHDIVTTYFRPFVMHKGYVLPLPESEKKQWALLQKQSDDEDTEILTVRSRSTAVEGPSYSNTIQLKQPVHFEFPKAQECVLNNGLKIFYYGTDKTPKINIVLEFKARPYWDPENKEGLYAFVADCMTEGTKNYTGEELADAIESRGMSVDVYPGGISLKMLHDDFEYGLDILKEILLNATFPEDEIEKVRDQILSDIKQYWDEPRSFVSQVVRSEIYKGHPYSKHAMGTEKSIKAITRKDLIDFYKKYISPSGARMAIVGDIRDYKLKELLEKKLQEWKSLPVEDIQFIALEPTQLHEINYPINRDQVVLCFAQLSINRKHPDFDKYLLFDQIFGGGALGSMSSRLFDLREQTGLFYTIRGSLIAGSDEQPGMFQIRTIVSLDRLAEAESAIKKTINEVVETLQEEELEEAKRAVISVLVDNFASNSSIASSYLFLDKYGFPSDYFDKRAAQIERVTLDDMKKAVKNMLNSENLLTVRIGRVEK